MQVVVNHGSISDVVNFFNKTLPKFKIHSFVKKGQSEEFELKKK